MKWLLRTLVILAAALVVVGIAFALNQSGALRMEGPERPDQALLAQQSGTDEGDSQEAGRPEHRERHEGGMGIFGAAEVLKNLVIVGLIVAIVAGSNALRKRAIGRMGRNRSPSASKGQVVHL